MGNFDYKKYTWIAGGIALLCVAFGALGLGMSAFSSSEHPGGQQASISVTGEGEATAIPDIATLNVTVRETGKTVPEAQKTVEAKIKDATDQMVILGIAEKDIKTTSYTVNPKYEYQNTYCINGSCPVGAPKIVGYDVAEVLEIKVRKIDISGDVIATLGKANITEITGPEFTVDDMDKIISEAKQKAVEDARAKAKETARSLGVDLGDIVGYSDDSSNMPYPMYDKAAFGMAPQAAGNQTVSIPTGETIKKIHVTIMYNLD
ncbi:MAG: hypothetical protein JWN37_56 [Candidatus Nomurabacteria bacterium]|nr:hypothetical protein [Candidatus Nomurabacteria bacterium]